MAKRKTQDVAMPEATKFPVKFSNVSIGDATAGIGLKISRDVLNPVVADDLLCGKRLQVMLVLGAGVDPLQRDFWADVRYRVTATVDVKGYNVNPKNVGFNLTFNLQEVEEQPLSHFAKKEGCLVIEKVRNIPKDSAGDGDDDEDDEDRPLLDEEDGTDGQEGEE